jgi:DNA polymerase-3 subunit chi
MTEVNFHTSVAQPTAYTCRLLRKAVRKGSKVVVTGPQATLAALDAALWTFDPVEFIPHLMPAPGRPVAPRLLDTPVWLHVNPAEAVHHQVLVNLGPDSPVGFESFDRVIEIVGADDDSRLAGRQRWKHYANRGYEIAHHEVAE